MQPKRFLLAAALGLPSFHGGCSLYAEEESCPVAECDSSVHTLSCVENQLMHCTPVSTVMNDSATVCPTVDVWATSDDCDEQGAECVADAYCAIRGVSCPPNTLAFCEFGRLFSCEGERVRLPESCYAEGTSCLEVTRPDGRGAAACALSTEPCGVLDGYECASNVLRQCERGYPVYERTCAAGEACSVEVPGCVLPEPCPAADGATLCGASGVYGCERTSLPVLLRDCAAFGEQCVAISGRQLCSTSSTGPGAPSFVRITGGTFLSGPRDGSQTSVTLRDFEMLEREVTVATYAACETAGACTPIQDELGACGWGSGTRGDLAADLPITCIDFEQATAVCAWLGARLPRTTEWEYALRNGGQDVSFPWGEAEADCEHAILRDGPRGELGCGRGERAPGCTRSDDRTAQGVCDLVGNVREWVVHEFADASFSATLRGASYELDSVDASDLRSSQGGDPWAYDVDHGVRCVR